MPTYAYRCVSCGETFEVFQPISAAPLETCVETVCPSTSDKGRGKVERLISGGAGLIFNGNGFYITDYKRTAQPSAEKNMKESSGSCSSGNCACGATE